jgi:peptidoglycan/xylan/chitin deacetylase (PgdA/CDA1 family)
MKLAFDIMYEEGCVGEPKMMTISLHNRLIGKPARFWALRELLTYIQSHESVWFATREEIARHWAKEHPFDEAKLNKMNHFL